MDDTWGYYAVGLWGYKLKINNDCESVTWLFVGIECKQCTHTAKIYYTKKGRAYFNAERKRIHLDECLRCKI